jgi:hypothetical protein
MFIQSAAYNSVCGLELGALINTGLSKLLSAYGDLTKKG